MDCTDDDDYIPIDPTDDMLAMAYANDVIDKIIKDINLMKHGTGNIKAAMAIKICKRYKK